MCNGDSTTPVSIGGTGNSDILRARGSGIWGGRRCKNTIVAVENTLRMVVQAVQSNRPSKTQSQRGLSIPQGGPGKEERYGKLLSGNDP